MAALSAAKKITKLDGPEFAGPFLVAANAIIYHGAMVALNGTGYLVPAATGSTIVVGIANLEVWDDQTRQGQASVQNRTTGNKIDNTGGADGARQCIAERGVFRFANKAGDLLLQTDLMSAASVENDQTVRKTAAGSITAGTLIRVDPDDSTFVYVQVPAGAYGRF